MPIVSLTEVNNALRLDIPADASEAVDQGLVDDVEAKIAQAEDIVLDYLKNPDDAVYWDYETAPDRVKAATIMVVDCLMKGDENANRILAGLQGATDGLANPVVALLYRMRDPAIA
jgi:N-acetylglucosamine kinase-like BadF-type ATPase